MCSVITSSSHRGATSAWGSCILVLKSHNHPLFPSISTAEDAAAVSVSLIRHPKPQQNPKQQQHPVFTLSVESPQWRDMKTSPCNSTWRLSPTLKHCTLCSFVRFPSEMSNNLQTNPIRNTTRCAHFAFHGNMLWEVSGWEVATQTRTISVLLVWKRSFQYPGLSLSFYLNSGEFKLGEFFSLQNGPTRIIRVETLLTIPNAPCQAYGLTPIFY